MVHLLTLKLLKLLRMLGFDVIDGAKELVIKMYIFIFLPTSWDGKKSLHAIACF